MKGKQIRYEEHNQEMRRAEREQKRLWIVSIVMLGALVASNTAWIIHFL